jgi:propionyl-CoA carboxylase alpha chain
LKKPFFVLTPELRKKMGEAAVLVAKSCDYLGAGTVEFLLTKIIISGDEYAFASGTSVTEWITGTDLVELQIRVARGEELAIKQEDLK